MLREIYGAQGAFPTLDLENFVERSLRICEHSEVMGICMFVSDVCHRFAEMERTPDNLLQAYCLEIDRWNAKYKAKHDLLLLLHSTSRELQTKLLERFFSFDRQQEERRILFLLPLELQRRIGRLLTPSEQQAFLEETQAAAS